MIVVGILVIALVGVVSFGAGVWYARTRLLPVFLARMSTREMSELAVQVTEERAQLRARVPSASAEPPSLR